MRNCQNRQGTRFSLPNWHLCHPTKVKLLLGCATLSSDLRTVVRDTIIYECEPIQILDHNRRAAQTHTFIFTNVLFGYHRRRKIIEVNSNATPASRFLRCGTFLWGDAWGGILWVSHFSLYDYHGGLEPPQVGDLKLQRAVTLDSNTIPDHVIIDCLLLFTIPHISSWFVQFIGPLVRR